MSEPGNALRSGDTAWTIGIIDGPNMSQLGKRDPTKYGTITWPELDGLFRRDRRRFSRKALRDTGGIGGIGLLEMAELACDVGPGGLEPPTSWARCSRSAHETRAETCALAGTL